MSSSLDAQLQSLIGYLPALLRISATMLLMPGLGEMAVPATTRVGLSLGITLALASALPTSDILINASIGSAASTVASELLTGLWFGWLTRLVASALPMAGQYAGYMVGLSNVLQADVDQGAQSSALSALFGTVAPVLFLASGLYRLPLRALIGFFDIVPVGHFLPVGDSVELCVTDARDVFLLSFQLASPFIAVSILWNLLIGQMARLGGRMQIYFLSFPGQILLGLLILLLAVEPMLSAWEHYAASILRRLPGG